MPPVRMSDELCRLLGKTESSVLPRNLVIQEVRRFLNENNMRNPENGGKYHVTPELKELFPTDAPEKAPDANEVGFFRLQKLLKHHIETVHEPQPTTTAE